MSTSALDDITRRAQHLAEQRERLRSISHQLQAGLEALKQQRMPEVRQAITSATEAWKSLEQDIRNHPELFQRPRTVIAHGLKYGMEKGKGTVEIPNPDKTVQLIEKHFPDQAEVLIDTKKTPAKDALMRLPAADLKKLGCEVTGTGDRVVIRPVEGETDKLVKALVKALAGSTEEGDAA